MSPVALSSPVMPQSAGEIAILDAAVHLFSEHGYDGVSMRRIAQAAGVSKANIYHHFDSKQALYFAIMRRSAEELSLLLETLAEGKGSFMQRLQVFAGAHLKHLFDHSERVRLVLREAFSGDEARSRMIVEHMVGGLVFIASIPFTKMRHLITAPLNIISHPRRKTSTLEPIEDIEETELLGVGQITEFAPHQLLSLDACVRCGRCDEACPAVASGTESFAFGFSR